MRLAFWGAAGMVTGSSYLLKNGNEELLVDMGMFQGEEKEELNMNAPEIDGFHLGGDRVGRQSPRRQSRPTAFRSPPRGLSRSDERYSPDRRNNERALLGVVLTHAHLDHCGRLPLLVQMGYQGEIYMTKASRDIVEIALLDSARINKTRESSLYTEEEVLKLFRQFKLVDFDREFNLGGFKINFRRAGHILGAASVEIKAEDGGEEKTIIFSGDLSGNKPLLIKSPSPAARADVVVMESTYGDRLHEKDEELSIIKEEVDFVLRTGGVLMIPAFSIQRSQRVLYRFHQLYGRKGLPGGMKVYFDSPMGIEVTRVFERRTGEFSDELKRESRKTDPFSFPGLVITEKAWESRKKISKDKGAKVIIAGSGMMSGGRILSHLARYLPAEKNRLLVVGYQAEGTLGREIVEGAAEVVIDEKKIAVKAGVRRIKSMSAHADQRQLLQWLANIQEVKKVILIHGDDEPRKALAEKIRSRFALEAVLPVMDEVIEI